MKCSYLLSLATVFCAATLPPTPQALADAAKAPYDNPPPAEPPVYRVRYDAGTQPGEVPYAVSYTVWVPPGVKTLRGLIVHQHGCGEGSCKSGQTGAYDLHWQALARKHDCALMSPSYEQPEKAVCSLWCDPRNGSRKRFLQGLEDLAKLTGHPELSTVPWALWGHSGGATWAGSMLLLEPDRIAAAWLRSGAPRLLAHETATLPPLAVPDGALRVPVMCNLGTKEGVTEKDGRFAGVWKVVEPFFKSLREKGGLAAVAVDPNSSHDCGNSRYLAIPWFDACLTARLPEKAGTGALKPMPTEGAHLAPVLGKEAVPSADYKEPATAANWLPDSRISRTWEQYSKDGNVLDATPPPAPTEVKLSDTGELTWEAQADLESGIAAFIIERDGNVLGRVPEKPAGTIGRPIFQVNGYSDSPTPPLAVMRYKVPEFKPGGSQVYRVRAVNSVGTSSEPSVPAASK